MAKPALLVVYGDQEMLAALEGDLGRRFGADYRIITAATRKPAWTRSGGSPTAASW
jgi:hypothetical protein